VVGQLKLELLSRSVELAPDYVPAIWRMARAISNSTNDANDKDLSRIRFNSKMPAAVKEALATGE
jgi:hypothetical protein